MREAEIPSQPLDQAEGKPTAAGEHEEPGEAADRIVAEGSVGGGLLVVEGECAAREPDARGEGGGGVEDGEEGGVVVEESGGRDWEVEFGFEERDDREREGFGGVGENVVLEGEGLGEVLLSFDDEVEVWVSDPLDLGVHEAPTLVQPVGEFGPQWLNRHVCTNCSREFLNAEEEDQLLL